ncbi:MAG: diphosphomevalonate decarboxylase [Pseudobdellovibrio sp.]
MWVESSAPSNIALIKYMGKTDASLNKPTNSSFSFCLEKLRTYVRIRVNPALDKDQWAAYVRDDLRPIELSEKGRAKFLNHFAFLKKEFKITENFDIESANNFPSDCGLASSASSFAALTLAAHDWLIQNSEASKMAYRPKELAKLSQKGSGSSCRSFFTPWSLWHADGAEAIQIPYTNLKHQVLLCDESIKSVSSSEAHVRVLTSDLFKGRIERAESRLQKLITSMRSENWKESFEICWNEFWDMHALFHTSSPSFMYMNASTMKALSALHNNWLQKGDGPLITMDAGSNIHLLYRPDQKAHYFAVINEFRSEMPIWTDEGYLGKL